jgi:hypothetical protein
MQQLIERFRNLPKVQQLAIGGGGAVALILIITAVAMAGGEDEPQGAATTTTATPVPVEDSTTTTTESVATTTTTEAGPSGPAWPLTGIVASDANPTAPILVAKVDNSSFSRPQAGISDADMVIEVLVEGGVARFLAFYQSNIPAEIGPIRSIREVDPKLIAPFDVAIAHSGGVASNVEAIRLVAVDVGDPVLGSTAYGRDPDRPAPYDLMLNPQPALDLASETSGDIWFRFEEATPEGTQALTVDISLSPITNVTYRWSSTDQGFLRFHGGSAHVDDHENDILAENVIVLFVRQIDTGRTDGAGNAVPDFQVTGSGEAVVFRDGVAITGTWERGSHDGFFRILDSAGRPIPLTPGNVWIELTPIGRSLAWR